MRLRKFLKYGAIGGAALALLWSMFFVTCRYTLCLQEDINTFVWGSGMFADSVMRIGGLSGVFAKFFVQGFTSPLLATSITAIVLAVISLIVYLILRKISGKSPYALALFPSLAFLPLLGEINYQFSGVITFLLAVMAIYLSLLPRRRALRVITALLALSLLYLVCGTDTPYTAWKRALWVVWLPWITLAVILAIALLIRGWHNISKKSAIVWHITGCCALIAYTAVIYKTYYNATEQHFAELAYYTGEKDWDSVISRSKKINLEDTRLQNCLNLALAEKGRLGERLFHHPCKGVKSLCDNSIKDPCMFMVLSDVYYSMGHISLAQRLAFEANEAFGNFSPRMLQRLVDTSLIFGQHALADKYLNILEKTVGYRNWAKERRSLVYDDSAVNAHPELKLKRDCISLPDRFAESHGIDDDLRLILTSNPQHTATMQYLGSLCLLEKNIPKFAATIDYFYGSGLIDSPLPTHFQEGIAIAAIVTGQPLDVKYRLHPSVMERCRDFWSNKRPQPNTLWHYLKVPR